MGAIDAIRVVATDAQRDLPLQQRARRSFTWDYAKRQPMVEEIPDAVRKSMLAREAYLRDVPRACDDENRRDAYAFYVGDRYFAYGHFAEARRFLTPLFEQTCTTSPFGYRTWVDLITMSNSDGNDEQSRGLAEAQKAHPCAGEPLETEDEEKEPNPHWEFLDPAKIYDAATRAPWGPERDALWRMGARAYEAEIRVAPAYYDSPTGAIRSAFGYLQAGEVNKAIELYRLFVREYASEAVLDWLERGGPEPRFRLMSYGAQPQVLKERLEQLVTAYDALASIYLAFFAYDRAAGAFSEMAVNARCDGPRREDAARRALEIYVALGERAKATQMHDVAVSPALRPGEEQLAEAEYLLASFDFRQWRPGGTMAGDPSARQKAISSLRRFHDVYRGRTAPAAYVVEAAYRIAKMEQSVGDANFRVWFKTLLVDWHFFQSRPGRVSAGDPRWADYLDEANIALREYELTARTPHGRAGILGGPGVGPVPHPTLMP